LVKVLLNIPVGLRDNDALGDPEFENDAAFDGVWGVAVTVVSELSVTCVRDGVVVGAADGLTLTEWDAPRGDSDDVMLPRRDLEAPRSREVVMLSDTGAESERLNVRDADGESEGVSCVNDSTFDIVAVAEASGVGAVSEALVVVDVDVVMEPVRVASGPVIVAVNEMLFAVALAATELDLVWDSPMFLVALLTAMVNEGDVVWLRSFEKLPLVQEVDRDWDDAVVKVGVNVLTDPVHSLEVDWDQVLALCVTSSVSDGFDKVIDGIDMVRSSVSVTTVVVSLGEALTPWFLRAEVSEAVRDACPAPRPRTVSLTANVHDRDTLSSNVTVEVLSSDVVMDAVRMPNDAEDVTERLPAVTIVSVDVRASLDVTENEFDSDIDIVGASFDSVRDALRDIETLSMVLLASVEALAELEYEELGEEDLQDTLKIIDVDGDAVLVLREYVNDAEKDDVGFTGDAVDVEVGVRRVALAERCAPDILFVLDALQVPLGHAFVSDAESDCVRALLSDRWVSDVERGEWVRPPDGECVSESELLRDSSSFVDVADVEYEVVQECLRVGLFPWWVRVGGGVSVMSVVTVTVLDGDAASDDGDVVPVTLLGEKLRCGERLAVSINRFDFVLACVAVNDTLTDTPSFDMLLDVVRDACPLRRVGVGYVSEPVAFVPSLESVLVDVGSSDDVIVAVMVWDTSLDEEPRLTLDVVLLLRSLVSVSNVCDIVMLHVWDTVNEGLLTVIAMVAVG
jgi:hypothetical protein